MVAGTKCDIEVFSGTDVITLSDVLFGDVWLCSGQSNMGFTMGGIFNSTEEIEASQGYTDIRKGFFCISICDSLKGI